MSRRLGDIAHDYPNAVVVGTLLVVVAGTLALSSAQADRQKTPEPAPLPPYDWCIEAANHPVSGFAGEVCEPLAEGYTEPDYSDYVYTGPMTWTYQGATVSVPGLAEDIADGCADTPDLLDCVGAIIGQRMEHRP